MTEDEWWRSDDVTAMLKWLRPHRRRVTDRKIRLFACACCRRIEHLLTDERLRKGLEAAEAYADQSTDLDGLKTAQRTVRAAWKRRAADSKDAEAVWKVAQTSPEPAARRAAAADYYGKFAAVIAAAAMLEVVVTRLSLGQYALPTHRAAAAVEQAALQAWVLGGGGEGGGSESGKAAYAAEWRAQGGMLRDLVGNPFRPVAVEPAWRTADVVLLAGGIYAERAFDRMPILADALQDAGCDSDDILDHCRGPQAVHIRGCWVMDLVLGKE
jgi:hypothetical protein